MKESDDIRFAEIIMGVADNFRDTVTGDGIDMRFEALKEFSVEQIYAASLKIMKVRKFTKMPPVAEFFTAIEGDTKAMALEAWGSVMQYLGNGCYGADPTNDKTQEVVRRLGGWDFLSMQTFEKLHWVEKKFMENFESFNDDNKPIMIDGKVEKVLEQIGMG